MSERVSGTVRDPLFFITFDVSLDASRYHIDIYIRSAGNDL